MTVPLDASHFVPALVEEGFTYHHADVDHAVLTKWLPDETKDSNKLPNPASHYVGTRRGWLCSCSCCRQLSLRRKYMIMQVSVGWSSTRATSCWSWRSGMLSTARPGGSFREASSIPARRSLMPLAGRYVAVAMSCAACTANVPLAHARFCHAGVRRNRNQSGV